MIWADKRMWFAPRYRVSGPEQSVCAVQCLAWHSAKPDFFFPLNIKYIYTVWLVPCPLYSAQRAIHRTENTNSVNKGPISAAASTSIYSVEGRHFEFKRAFDWTKRLMRRWSTMWRQKNCWAVLAEVTNFKLWLLISSKCSFFHSFGAHCLITLRLTNWY